MKAIFYIKTMLLSLLLVSFSANAQTEVDPHHVYLEGPILWHVQMLQCEELGPEPLVVEFYIEEGWGFQMSEHNSPWSDANGGAHLVQPAHWIMSANTLDYSYEWLGRATGKAIFAIPSQTNGGTIHFGVQSRLHALDGGPDLFLDLLWQVVASATGDLRILVDEVDVTCR